MAVTVTFDCPHCKKNVYRCPTGWKSYIGCPIKICPYCNREYIFPHVYEWSISGPFYQIYYTFFSNGRFMYLLGVWFAILFKCWIAIPFVIVFWIFACLLRLKTWDSDEIVESYKRTKDNPEYLQKLSDMGYWYIDFRIDPFYK